MRFGFHFLDFTLPGEPTSLAPTIAATANAAANVGASWFTLIDHWFQMEGVRTALDPMLEGYTTLGFVAAQTSTIKLGTVVTGVTYRHPGLLVKTATTLDVLSEGRAFFGIGAAWYEREHRGLGVPYPSTTERFERLEETLQIVRQAWNGGGSYAGEHYSLDEITLVPQPLRPGGPRVMIGGSGERRTLRLVAQYGDACNLFGTTPDEVPHKLDVLRAHCDDVGRDYDEISKTIVAGRTRPLDDIDAWLASMEALAACGIEQVWTTPDPSDPVGWTERMAEQVVPRLAAIG